MIQWLLGNTLVQSVCGIINLDGLVYFKQITCTRITWKFA